MKNEKTAAKCFRIPIEIYAKCQMKQKFLRTEGKRMTLMECIESMIEPQELVSPQYWNLNNPDYVIGVYVKMSISKRTKINKLAARITSESGKFMSAEMYINNLLNVKLK